MAHLFVFVVNVNYHSVILPSFSIFKLSDKEAYFKFQVTQLVIDSIKSFLHRRRTPVKEKII